MLSKKYYTSDNMQLYTSQNISQYEENSSKSILDPGKEKSKNEKDENNKGKDKNESLFSKLVNSNNRSKMSKYGKNVEEYFPEETVNKYKFINNPLFDEAGYNPDDYVFKPSGYSTNTSDPSSSPFYVPCHYSPVDDKLEQGSDSHPSRSTDNRQEINNTDGDDEEKYDFEFADDEINALLNIEDDNQDEQKVKEVSEDEEVSDEETSEDGSTSNEVLNNGKKDNETDVQSMENIRQLLDDDSEDEKREEELSRENTDDEQVVEEEDVDEEEDREIGDKEEQNDVEMIVLSESEEENDEDQEMVDDAIILESIKESSQPIITHSSEPSILKPTKTSKIRVAHCSDTMVDHNVLRQKTHRKVNTMKSLKAVLEERYKKTLEPKLEEEKKPVMCAKLNLSAVKIAPVPNVQRLLEEKKRIEQLIKTNATRAQTSKSTSRVAHKPANVKMKKHTITEGSHVAPVVVRQQCFDKILTEVLKINLTNEESLTEAIKLEQDVFKSSTQKKIYQIGIAKVIMQLRRKSDMMYGKSKQNLTNCKRQTVNYNSNSSVVNYKKIEMSDLSEDDIYERLIIYKLSPEDLVNNGFPIKTDKKNIAKCSLNMDLHYYKKYNYIKRQDVNKRYCIRCSKVYEVDPITLKQLRVGDDVCMYHPGRKINSNLGRVYSCCNSSSEPCSSHTCHVTDNNNYEQYENCVKTKGSRRKIYALDCEMVYTSLGTELARVTVINLEKKVVYDTLVKPKYNIECYNSQFSGLTEEMFVDVTTNLSDVQNVLLKLFGSDTILIGHSLDSDFRALHLIHDTVVDTSLAFPSSRTNNKRALRELCGTYLNKIIQNDLSGHDSTEDAVASLELMLYKVKEDLSKFYT